MRPIKFRGRRLANGEWVYGDLLQFKGKPAIISNVGELIYYAATKQGLRGIAEVEPESVAQLVGYDEDGYEVYEGDELVGRFNQVWVANVYCGAENNDDWIYYTDIKNLKLKKIKCT